VYYSGGLDWRFEPHPQRTILDAMAGIPRGAYPAYADAQVRELIERYEPSVLWNDIAWPTDEATLFRLFADYYAAVPEGVVNDRWLTPTRLIRSLRFAPVRKVADALLYRAIRKAKDLASLQPPPPPHYDARTPEYPVFPTARPEKWESVRGIDKSFGFNRLSKPEDHLSREDLLTSLADITSKNGNLLLNVGPRGDATIPDVQAERLRWLGAFLERQGEAIQGTRPWIRSDGSTDRGIDVRFSRRGDRVYALLLARPAAGDLVLEGLRAREGAAATWLGRPASSPEPVRPREDGRVVLTVPSDLDESPVHAVALDRVENG
jgi:alpha-L-fucosidase